MPACSGGEGGRLDPSACVHFPHRRRLVPVEKTFSPLAKPPRFALGEQSVQVLATTMRVSHTFEVVQKAKVAAVFGQGDIDPVRC